jgi:hypothetical protein
MKATIIVADCYCNRYTHITKWDGTEEGKIEARKEAYPAAKAAGFEWVCFVASEIFEEEERA